MDIKTIGNGSNEETMINLRRLLSVHVLDVIEMEPLKCRFE
jgi:hypothetical protein